MGDKAREDSAVLKIATWNVNSINARLETAISVLKTIDADVIALQEIKCEDARFPRGPIEEIGYNVETYGQKTYNGVALLSKFRIEEVARGLPLDEHEADDHARYIEAVIAAPGGPFRVGGLYAPNGNPIGTDKFTYKLDWLARLISHAEELLSLEEPIVLMGDYNIIPEPEDCFDPKAWEMDALFQPESRSALRHIEYLGYSDALRACHNEPRLYTFWDYTAGCWQKDRGIRIDHILLSPQAADRLSTSGVNKHMRGREKPSDHVPVWCELAV